MKPRNVEFRIAQDGAVLYLLGQEKWSFQYSRKGFRNVVLFQKSSLTNFDALEKS